MHPRCDEPQAHGAEYLELVARVRAARSDIALSGISLSAFPGESDADFEATTATSSARWASHRLIPSNTARVPARRQRTMDGHVDEAVKSERLERLQALLFQQQREFARTCIGKEIDLLLEKPGRMPGQLVGRSPWLQPVNIDAKASEIGDIIRVRITDAGPNSLFAEAIR
jgi:tRNA-2-methylthio-N6-dimethylallyladenosine synthase